MLGSAFIDEIGSSNNCGDFFGNIEDWLDFPVEEDLVGGGVVNQFDTSGPEPPIEPVFNNTTPELDTGLAIPPYEDFPQMEWLSSFMEESFSDRRSSILLDSGNIIKSESNDFQTSSPVSVLESSSSSSCYGGKKPPLNAESFIRGRARSKRPRPATFNPHPVVIQLISPTSSIMDSEILSETGNHAESSCLMSSFKPKKKIKRIKTKDHSQSETNLSTAPPVRKCLHCEITKTPQWRAGPMGRKTLCNACGVRYKSGRLCPEYRPAASPTFVSSKHSNSHKKVLEMRIRTCEKQTVEFLPKASHLVDEI